MLLHVHVLVCVRFCSIYVLVDIGLFFCSCCKVYVEANKYAKQDQNFHQQAMNFFAQMEAGAY